MIRHFFPGTDPGRLTWRRFVRLGGRGALTILRLHSGQPEPDDGPKEPAKHF
jgi:hypothetical protein